MHDHRGESTIPGPQPLRNAQVRIGMGHATGAVHVLCILPE
jgi:hypothetical protein